MTASATGLDRDALDAILQRTDPAAVLVPQRILRRVIKRARALTGPGLQVPHRKCIVIGRDALLTIASRNQLGVPAERELPAIVLLLAEMDVARLAALPRGEALRKYWRLLFHARLHAELEQRRADGKLNEADARVRVTRIGRSPMAAAAAVLRQENLLLPPGDLGAVYEEFAALYLELRHFEPRRLPLYFPLAPFEEIDRVLADDVDAAALFARTRLEGATEPFTLPEAPDAWRPQADTTAETEPAPAAFARLTAGAARSRRRGNLVRAALRSERAARVGDARQRIEARAAVAGDLDRLMYRLQKALDLPLSESAVWRQGLDALLGAAAGGLWTAEGRLLYDLQKVCLDAEREVYVVDFVEWFVTWFRRPLRRHLPHQRLVLILKHLRRAVKRLPAVRLSPELRTPFHAFLHAAVRRSEERIRDRFRPGARAALDGVGLTGHNRAECVSRDKIIEELLDRVVERDMLTMSDLRDAVARNRVKLPDLSGPGEFFLGDRLIRANRVLAHQLDGVYRRGEIYLRWLQRGTSAAFGTRIGRALTRYIALPFGGAFILLEGFKAVLHELPAEFRRKVEAGLGLDGFKAVLNELPAHQPSHAHDAAWLANHLRNDIIPTGILGLFLLGVLYVPTFRRLLLDGLALANRGIRAVCIDLPALVMSLPAVRRILQSRAYALLYLFVLKPVLFAAPVSLGLYLADGNPQYSLVAGGAVFLATVLLLNSPLGSHVEELLADHLVRGWELVRRDVLPGLYHLVVGVFRMLMERLERLMYAVDEWLRFRTGDSMLSAAVKPVLGLAWFVIAYALRSVINLFVEPTFNPIKHFPVVTVAAKLLLPFIPTLVAAVSAAAQPILGVWLAGIVSAALLFFIPGFAGFLVWELKENWRLYAANQPLTLQAEIVGSHGETVRRLLRPGFHSGTVPKLFAKLRRADGKAARKQQEGLHHVAEALKRFVERDLLAILKHSPRWGDSYRLRPGELSLGTNCIRVELRSRDLTDPPLCLDIDEQGGRLVAGIETAGWLPRLAPGQRRALADALAGFYHLAGIDLVREEIESALPPGASFDVTERGLLARAVTGTGIEVLYPLDPGKSAPPANGWPELSAEQLRFSSRPIRWTDWVETWEEDGENDLTLPAASDGLLLRTG
jgi:hypothetical protein